MKQSRHLKWSAGTLIVWLLTNSLAPVVALHVAFEHDEHSEAPSSAHHDETAPADHDRSDHHHPQIGVGLAQAVARPQDVAMILVPVVRICCATSIPPGPTYQEWLDSAVPTHALVSRSPILLL